MLTKSHGKGVPVHVNAKTLKERIESLGAQWDSIANASINEKWSRLTNNGNVSRFGTDEFGFSPEFVKRILPLATLVHKGYFRVSVSGVENVPTGRTLLIANHSGQLPFDGMMIATSLILEADPPRMVRSMIEKWVPTLPFISTLLTRCGQITGIPENCSRLLEADETILVFPEGARGISKTYDKRYQLQSFGQGFMRLALQTGTPIVPVSVVGAEEQAPSFYNVKPLARLLNMPAFPITPFFPLFFPFGLLPMPVKYHIHFGEPMVFDGHGNEEDAVIMEKVARVEEAVTKGLERLLDERTHVFW